MREKQLNVRLNQQEVERIELLTEHYGIDQSAVIRMLLKREADVILCKSKGKSPKTPTP